MRYNQSKLCATDGAPKVRINQPVVAITGHNECPESHPKRQHTAISVHQHAHTHTTNFPHFHLIFRCCQLLHMANASRDVNGTQWQRLIKLSKCPGRLAHLGDTHLGMGARIWNPYLKWASGLTLYTVLKYLSYFF